MAITGEVYVPCLQIGLPGRDYEQILKDHLEYMDGDIKTPNHIYQGRLSAYSQCRFLRNEMCKLYGCLVAPRAAKIHDHCIDTPMK